MCDCILCVAVDLNKYFHIHHRGMGRRTWGKEGNKSKGGYQDNSDEDDNAHRGYSPEPASEYKDNEGTAL